MKNAVFISIIIAGLFLVPRVFANQPFRSGSKDLNSVFSDKNQKTADNGMHFGFSLRHVEAGKYVPRDSIKSWQIFPVNTVTGGFSYDFS
ncbi:MAG TPA: hypothetical protein VL360_07865 [Gammaproteobacteria bacterium]|nr:hypothetical protein [Gammaproteobacteria bacterium]